MRSIVLFIILGFTLTSCYTWKRGFVTENNGLFQKCKEKRIGNKYLDGETDTLNATDFFYLRQVEYFEFINNGNTDSTDDEPYTNEVSAALYKSVPVGYALKRSERTVEEKYMCIHGLSNDSAEAGVIYYFRTATYWGEGADNGGTDDSDEKLKPSMLLKHFENDTVIDLSTSKRLQIGYWARKDDTLQLFMNDGTDIYEVKATYLKDRLMFNEISHPNKEGSSKDANSEQYLELKKVMNVQDNPGLIYYRNVKADTMSQAERQIKVTYVENDTTFVGDAFSICYQTKRHRLKNLDKGYCEIVLRNDTVLKQRRKYHKTTAINEDDYLYIAEKKVIPTEKDIRNMKQDVRKAARRQKKLDKESKRNKG